MNRVLEAAAKMLALPSRLYIHRLEAGSIHSQHHQRQVYEYANQDFWAVKVHVPAPLLAAMVTEHEETLPLTLSRMLNGEIIARPCLPQKSRQRCEGCCKKQSACPTLDVC